MEDQLAQIRLAARKKYEEKCQQEELVRREAERQEQLEQDKQREVEQRIQRDLDLISSTQDIWDGILVNFPLTTEHIESLYHHTREIIDLLHEYHRMDSFQERVLQLVDTVNLQQEELHGTAEEVRRYGQLMKDLLALCEIEVEIDLMDTTEDEVMAERLQFELHNEPFIDIPVQEHPQVHHPRLPMVSLTRRIGLTLPALQHLCREHGISTKGNKSDVVRRLVEAGKVRLH